MELLETVGLSAAAKGSTYGSVRGPGGSEIKGLGFNHQKMGKFSNGPWISVVKI